MHLQCCIYETEVTMDDHVTEPFQPYEPADEDEGSYDFGFDPEDEPRDRPNILWGRVAILGGGLLLAFLIGRASAPSGVPQAELDQARAERDAATEEVESLRAQIEALQQPAEGPGEEQGGEEQEEEPEVAAETYVVKSGDTLRLIAQDFYGDPELADLIAEANDITDPTSLHVGQELVIPPKPSD